MPRDIVDLPVIGRAASVRPDSVNREARTCEVVWTTGAIVQRARFGGCTIERYEEELSVDPAHIRLDRLRSGAPFLDTHRSWSLDSVLGVVEPDSVRIENGRGYARVRFSEREDVEPVWRDVCAGIIRNVSVGYRVYAYEIEKRDGEMDLWRAIDWEPFEISAVPIPADPGSQVRSETSGAALNSCVLTRQDAGAAAAAFTKGTTMSERDEAAANEADRNENGTQEQRANGGHAPATPETSAQTPAAQTRNDPATPDGSGVDAEQVRAEERARVATISQLCRRHGMTDEFEADMVRRGVSVEAARGAILDQLAENDPLGRSYEPAPAQARREDGQQRGYREAVTSSLLHRYLPGTYELAEGGREYRGMTLLELARDSLERSGVSTRGMSKMDLAGAVFARAGGLHSTSDFAIILANVANMTLRDAYQGTPRTFSVWARRSTISDFKPVTRAQMGGAPDLQKVLETGEFQYGTMGESKEVYALATYGRIIGISRQALINDDMDAFTRVPAAFGAAAADLESDIVYSILKDNPAMQDGVALFHADHGNLGSASVISEAALATAFREFGKQKGIENRLISVLPRYIIVPPGQRSVEARKQITATTPAATSDVNTFAGRLQPVEEPRLIPASGQDPWFLAADPARIDTVEFAYLDGQEGVFTETRTGFEVDGIEIKARHDFAAKAIDHRGLYKNPGAAAT